MKKLYIIFIVLFTANAFAYINQTITNSCGDYPKIYAVFEPISYTCNSGYFLPADTLGCQPCPSGYTCSGGTFSFNERQSQGATRTSPLTTQTISKSCASNAPHEMVAIFTPATVNITWDDGNGNTTTGTCIYDGELTLPTEPSRPGYTFAGWKVKTSNNN